MAYESPDSVGDFLLQLLGGLVVRAVVAALVIGIFFLVKNHREKSSGSR